MAKHDGHTEGHGHPSQAPDVRTAPPGSPTHAGGFPERAATRRCQSARATAEARVFRSYGAAATLIDRLADFDAMLAALEERPAAEGPLEACRALAGMPVVAELALGPDDVRTIQLLSDHPSLSGHFFWRMQAVVGRMAIEFGRRMGVPPTDLRPQLLAACVMAALNAALTTWLSDPEGTPVDELMRRALAHLGDGMDWPGPG